CASTCRSASAGTSTPCAASGRTPAWRPASRRTWSGASRSREPADDQERPVPQAPGRRRSGDRRALPPPPGARARARAGRLPGRRAAAAGERPGRRPRHGSLARRRRLPGLARQPAARGERRRARRAGGGLRGPRARRALRGRTGGVARAMSRFRVSMDIGGTFTDVVAYDEERGTYVAGKSSTTPRDLTAGVLDALGTIDAHPELCGFVVHGTTQGLNAFLQRRGERVLLLATAGAGDVYHIARGNRTRLYDIHFRKPTPLVPRADLVEIGGRLNYAGEELEPLDADAVRAAARRVREEGFGAVAVAFLFSFLNPAHELEAEAILL